MKKFMCFVLIMCFIILTASSCNVADDGTSKENNTKNDTVEYDNSVDESEKESGPVRTFTDSELISLAKRSYEVQNEIERQCKLKFAYSPNWGTCTVDSDWSITYGYDVTLKGNISGYTDDYKDDFEKVNFTAQVTISYSGDVRRVFVYTS